MILRWLIGALTTALAIAIAGVVIVLSTGRGAAWLAREAQAFAPQALRIGTVSGSLLAGMHIDELDIRAGHTAVALRGLRARIDARGLLRGRLEIAGPGIDAMTVVVSPDPQDRSLVHIATISTPLPIELREIRIARIDLRTGSFQRIFTDVAAEVSLRDTHLELRRLRARSGAAAVDVAGSAELRHPLPLRAALRWSWEQPALEGSGTVEGDLDLLHVRQAVRAPGTVTVQAELRGLNDRPQLDAKASWEQLAFALPGAGTVSSQGGRFSIAGGWEHWQASLAARLVVPKLPAGVAAFSLRGVRDQVTIEELRVGGAFGLITGSGTVDLSSGAAYALDLRARDIDPGSVRADARGRLSARVQLNGRVPDMVNAQLTELAGTLMGRPLAGHGLIAHSPGVWELRDIDLSAGTNHLVASGRFTDRIEGRFTLDAPRLDVLWPALKGAVHGSAEVGGTLAHPSGRIALSGHELHAGDNRLRALELAGRIDPQGNLQMTLDARGLNSGGQSLGDVQAGASGLLARHTLEAKLSGGVVAASLAAHGGWTGRAVREEITAATVSAARVGEWRLQPPGMRVEAAATRADIADHCWLQAQAALCLAGLHWSPGAATLTAALRGLSVDRIADLLPQDWVLAGTASANLALRRDRAGIAGNFGAELQNGALYFVGGDEPLVRTFPFARLGAELTPALLTTQAEISGDGGIRLRGEGRLVDPLTPSGALTGRVEGEMADLGDLLPLLIPGNAVSDIRGRLTLAGTVAGTRDAPRATGELLVRDGTLALTAVGVRLEAINLSARGNETATLVIDGNAKSGGDVSLTGSVELTGKGAPAARLRIRGQDLDAVRIPDRYVRASPDITLVYRAGRLSVDGTVAIPKADIVVRELPASAASPSVDAVVHGRPAAEPDRVRTLKIDGDLKLVFGDAVHLKAFGLDTGVTGGLRIYQTPDGSAAGEGLVRLEEGRFKAYGRELTIERGNLIFSGPLDNPGLDVRASRRVDFEAQTVTVGLQLSGTAERVESHVFSEPAMGEADALSYLVAGRPLARASATDQSSVASAAISLGLGQTAPITQQIGSAVALDELGLQGSGLQTTEIFAGKQIGPDLYIRFAYGLFNRVGSILARYRLGKRLSIEASSGERQSLDLVYSVETN